MAILTNTIMKLDLLKAKQALHKTFLRTKVQRSEIEKIKAELSQIIAQCRENESEEYHKNLIADFLKRTYYHPNYSINTEGKNDLVIHSAKDANSPIAVLIETKSPSNKNEMLQKDKYNTKALHEMLLYFLRERISKQNLQIKHIIISNLYDWFIFDAQVFEKAFAQNTKLVQQFKDFEAGRLTGKNTDFFYKEIAFPYIDKLEMPLECCHINLKDYHQALKEGDDEKLISLYKILSPQHLLKLPFQNDSNTLDNRFYTELLHILGLTEVKKDGKKLIQRKQIKKRDKGSLLENAITQIDTMAKLDRIETAQYGKNKNQQLFHLALELCITWINRILFLKLLEAQLLAYHKGNQQYAFLNIAKIKDYDELNSLFFQVIARKAEDRDEDIQKRFKHIPYLNSSLFELSETEHKTLVMSNLQHDKKIPLFENTVLKDDRGKTEKAERNTLSYLFAFLDAYDFSTEGKEQIQEQNKTLINASVLGLIFEKINGYQDGSFFTPGFITMYMCRESIQPAVVQRFNQTKGWNCKNLKELYNQIEDREEANQIINGLKICDPAVGSGHFLVSALNEIIYIKHELRILQDRQGKRLKEYHIQVLNDELVVFDEDGTLFDYVPNHPEAQRVQETLFHEKQRIIENCLFGVDININSVKICRLRLWIELLKHAYYKTEGTLETLPNIDINIKCGNALVSRFALDSDIKDALKKSKWTIQSYQLAVDRYRNAENSEEKRQMEKLIETIKEDFTVEVGKHDKTYQALKQAESGLEQLRTQTNVFGMSEEEKAHFNQSLDFYASEIDKFEKEIEQKKSNPIYRNAFEWRFEFPEVLNEKGDFVGFDLVTGNPPYIQLQSMKEESKQIKALDEPNELKYQSFESTGDLYCLFYERGVQLLKQDAFLAYITSNKWMRANYGRSLRSYFLRETKPYALVDLGSNVFEEATVDSNLLFLRKQKTKEHREHSVLALDLSKEKHFDSTGVFEGEKIELNPSGDGIWAISSKAEQALKAKIESIGIPLKDWDIRISYGIKTGYNEAFIIDKAKRDEMIAQDPKSEEIIKPILRGRDIKRYHTDFQDMYLIAAHNGYKIGKNKRVSRIEIEHYPAVKAHLDKHWEKISKRQDKGATPYNLRNCAYYKEFEKEKIIYSEIVQSRCFHYDTKSYFAEATSFILSGKSLKYIILVLNSFFLRILFQKILCGRRFRK